MADFEGTKELNFDENVSLEELGRLRLENRDLQLAREKLVKKLDKKKNELENEKTHTTTLRQLIQELNRKVELLEREPIPVISPLRIDPGPGMTGEVVERLVMEKTGLESNLAEQKTEIETLNTKIVLTNQSLEIARGENARFEKLVPELKLELSRMENECKRMSTSTISEDETIETETLKTRLQDLSITNKHYLSQLQKKDLTIAKSTNKFETEKQQILELSRLEIEKLKQNETSLNEQLIKVKRELDHKCSALEDDKSVLEIQVDVLNGQIGELSEERERCKGRVVELETTLTDLQLQLRKLGEVQQNETATVKKYEQQLTELTNQITILNNELTSVKESASISKQLINKLNQDIEVLETNNKQTIVEFQTKLTQSERDREDLERKLGEMARELADRDSRIQELSQPVVIPQSRGQVPKSPSTPVMPTNPKLEENDKPQSKGRDSKSRFPEPSAGATNMNLTPEVIPQANKTNKTPSKISFRCVNIPVVKLKAFSNPTESYNKQVICTINKRSELGVLMCIFEVQTKVGFKIATTRYAGIKLYNPVGNCDGTYKDKKYFDCSLNCGIFVPLEEVYVPVP